MSGRDDEADGLLPIFRSLLLGQCGHALRVSLWWGGLSPLVLAFIGKDSALGLVRFAFNLGLLLISPIAGVFAEKIPMEKMLTRTLGVRVFLYGVYLPLVWFLFRSGYVWDSLTACYVLVLLLALLDGIQVAFCNVVDIDMGGVDILAGQRGLTVTDKLRNKMNSIYQIAFDSSFIFFTPLIALLSWYIGAIVSEDKKEADVDGAKAGVLILTFGGVFIVTGAVSYYYYAFGLARNEGSVVPGGEEYSALSTSEEAETTAVDVQEVEGLFASVWTGAKLCWQTRPILYRLLFLGLEVAFEDAMVSVLVAEYAYSSRFFGDGDPTESNLATALIIGVSKIGAILAGWFMHSVWKPPTTKGGFYPLFASVLLGSISVCGLVLAHQLELGNLDQPKSATAWLSRVLVFVSVFLFFLFSTAPKIGFATLLQGLASSVEGSGKIFGFVGPAISIVDSVVIMIISFAFGAFKGQCQEDDEHCRSEHFGYALLLACGLYLLHGVVECFIGPKLMLPNDPTMLRNVGISETE
mmetsp:Transcript_14983/g.24385  ORF Transcript_14983/g.24385 Transcript_14983/m.24385 type:complete len:524 (+) Transcript_14983:195-1766(+)